MFIKIEKGIPIPERIRIRLIDDDVCVRACRSEISQGQGEANEQTAEASKFLLEP
jgi:hypothetical protein